MINAKTPTNYPEFEACFTDVFHLLIGEIDAGDTSLFEPMIENGSPEEDTVHNLLFITFCRFFPLTCDSYGYFEPDYERLKEKYDYSPEYYTAKLMSYIDILNKYDAKPLAYTTYSWRYIQ